MDIWHLSQRVNIATSLLLPHLCEVKKMTMPFPPDNKTTIQFLPDRKTTIPFTPNRMTTNPLFRNRKTPSTIQEELSLHSPTCCLKDSDSPSPRNTSSKLRAMLSSSLVVTNLRGGRHAATCHQGGLT